MSKRQTAVEWLASMMNDHTTSDEFYTALQQAKEMERQQIIDAYFEGRADESEGFPMEIVDNYYNNTYNHEQNH